MKHGGFLGIPNGRDTLMRAQDKRWTGRDAQYTEFDEDQEIYSHLVTRLKK